MRKQKERRDQEVLSPAGTPFTDTVLLSVPCPTQSLLPDLFPFFRSTSVHQVCPPTVDHSETQAVSSCTTAGATQADLRAAPSLYSSGKIGVWEAR